VTMNAGADVPPVTQRVYMWTAPSPTSPYSLARAVELLTTSEWEGWDTQRVNSLFDFLIVFFAANPAADFRLELGDIALVVGPPAAIDRVVAQLDPRVPVA